MNANVFAEEEKNPGLIDMADVQEALKINSAPVTIDQWEDLRVAWSNTQSNDQRQVMVDLWTSALDWASTSPMSDETAKDDSVANAFVRLQSDLPALLLTKEVYNATFMEAANQSSLIGGRGI